MQMINSSAAHIQIDIQCYIYRWLGEFMRWLIIRKDRFGKYVARYIMPEEIGATCETIFVKCYGVSAPQFRDFVFMSWHAPTVLWWSSLLVPVFIKSAEAHWNLGELACCI